MQRQPWKIRVGRVKPIGQPYGQPGRPAGRTLDAMRKGEPTYLPNPQDTRRRTARLRSRLAR